jgi:hypothetical protein
MKQGLSAGCATGEAQPENSLLHEYLRFGHIYPGGRNWALFRPTRLPEKLGQTNRTNQTKGVLGNPPSL